MRAVLQRTKQAKCIVTGKTIGAIGEGFLVLVGFTAGDNDAVLARMAQKIVNLRVFPDPAGKMNLSIRDIGGAILSISQFTLYADTNAGNRPSFTSSLNPDAATVLYDRFNQMIAESGIRTETGIFGAHMEIELINDGPVTIMLEYKS